MRALIFALLIAFQAALPAAWLRLSSPHFELLTDAGDRNGREVLSRLEQIRQVFLLPVGDKGSPLPVRVFLFNSEQDYRAFRPTEAAAGFFQSGPERDFIVMRQGQETARVVFHEYVHLVLHHASGPLPRWFEEGNAEFYSTLSLEGKAGEGKLVIGRPIESHVHLLRTGGWMQPNALAAVSRDSPYYNERGKAGLFYAQSWAMVHMLRMTPALRANLPRFTALLEDGVPDTEAFRESFGRDFEAVAEELKSYVDRGSFAVATLAWAGSREFEVESAALSIEDTEQALADLSLRAGRPAESEKRLRSLARSAPDSAEVATSLGLLELSRKRNEEAKRHFRRAIDLRAAPSTAYFEYAMLLREEGGDPAEVDRLLRETVGRNPKHAEALFLLGLRAAAQGQDREAIGWFARATGVLPRQSYFWHAQALAHHRLGETTQALRAARRSLEAASLPHEVEMARAAVQLTSQPPAAPPAPRPAVTTPESWRQRRGDTLAEGVLDRIDCLGTSARFHVSTAGGVVRLWVDKPGEVLLKQTGSVTFQFSCGPQEPRRVAIEYLSKPDSARSTAGEVTAISLLQ